MLVAAVDAGGDELSDHAGLEVGAQAQAGLVEVGLIPALKEDLVLRALAESEIDRDNPYLIFVRQALKALENGFPYPIIPEMAAYITPLDIALRETFGGVDPAEALARVTFLETIPDDLLPFYEEIWMRILGA